MCFSSFLVTGKFDKVLVENVMDLFWNAHHIRKVVLNIPELQLKSIVISRTIHDLFNKRQINPQHQKNE